MEASAIQAGPGLGRSRITLGTPLLRLRSDQQLVTLFREGNEDAFRVIHDRYRPRLQAYVRQMLSGRTADVEDALQDVFVRTYAGLRTSNREFALRPWLYRVAHNRCIDELRRPQPMPVLLLAHDRLSDRDPAAETEQRESLRRLVIDIGRLPDQQRSALLMRELSGMTYADVAGALEISVPAVKSLLVRARVGLAQAIEARDAACADIRHELANAHEEGVRPSWMARRHLRECEGCRACRAQMRTQRRQVAALAPTIGPLAVLAKVFGIGTGAGGGTATAASAGGATAAGGTATAATGLATVTVGHVATILAAAVVTAGGAVAVQQTVSTHGSRHAKHATQHAAAATSAVTANDETMRVPAVIPRRPAARHAQAPVDRHAASTTAGPVRWHARVRHRAVAMPSEPAATESTSSETTSTTCPPPPAACTASQTTCSTGSSSTTSSSTQTTTTPQTTTTLIGPTTTTTPQTTTTPTGPTSATTAPACSSTPQPTSAQATGTGQTASAQATKPT